MKKENLKMTPDSDFDYDIDNGTDNDIDNYVDEQVDKHYKEWCDAVAQDLQQIAVLNDREVDTTLIEALREVNFPYNLGFQVVGNNKSVNEKLHDAQRVFSMSLDKLPGVIDQQVLDVLAVDYADIYLNHSIHASPFESVWLDEDHLIQQEPMFKIREWYKPYGLASEDWRLRSEDHIVLQLQFIAMLLDPQSDFPVDIPLQKRLEDATNFMDEHLLLWLEDFSTLVAQRCGTDFYASTAVLTHAYMDQLRDALAEITEVPRPTAEQVQEKLNRNNIIEEPITFMPGVAESW